MLTHTHSSCLPGGCYFKQTFQPVRWLYIVNLDLAQALIVLWDHVNNGETPLPDMPNGVIRVYPASAATAMLPLTPANNWTPTILFCGGSTISDQDWGDYSGPFIDTWNVQASKDCQR